MIAIILLVVGALIVIFALSFLFSWFFFAPKTTRHAEQTQLSDADLTEEFKYLNYDVVKKILPQFNQSIISQPLVTQDKLAASSNMELALSTLIPNQLSTTAVKKVILAKQANSPKGEAFFIAIFGRFEVGQLNEYATQEKIKQNLLEAFKKEQLDEFNFEFNEEAIDNLAYQVAFDIASGLGSSTEFESFIKNKDYNKKYTFQNAKTLFKCSAHFEGEGKTWVDVEIIIQGVKAIDFNHGKELFKSLPEKFLLDVTQPTSHTAKLQ